MIDKLKKLVEKFKTIAEVARQLDTDRSTVYRWLEGKTISKANQIRIEEKYNDNCIGETKRR